jgi:hypothetical protein
MYYHYNSKSYIKDFQSGHVLESTRTHQHVANVPGSADPSIHTDIRLGVGNYVRTDSLYE